MANDVTRRILIRFDAETANAEKAAATMQNALKDEAKAIYGLTIKHVDYVTKQRDANGKFIVSQKAVVQMYIETQTELKKIEALVGAISVNKLGTEFKDVAQVVKVSLKSVTQVEKEEAKQREAAIKAEEKEKRAERKKTEADAKQSAKEQTAAEKERIAKVAAAEREAYKEDARRRKDKKDEEMREIAAEVASQEQLARRLRNISNESFKSVQDDIAARLKAQQTFANTAVGIEQKLARDIAREHELLHSKLLQWEFERIALKKTGGTATIKTNKEFSDAVQMSSNTARIRIGNLIDSADAAKQALIARELQEAQWRMEANSYRAHQREMQQALEQRLQLDQLSLARNGGRRAVLLQQQANTEANIRRTYAAQIQTYERALQQGFISTAQANQYATTALGHMQTQLQSTRAALEQHLTALGGTEQRTQSLAVRVLEMIGLYRIWSAIINTVVAALKSIPATGIEMQATQSALHASLSNTASGKMDSAGGEVRTAQAMKMLQDEADRTGISILTLEKNYRTFLASTTMAGESVDTTTKMFKDLNTTITALHMTGDRAELTFLALAQMFNKGKIQSEELVKQLGNLLPGAFAAFAAANNISTQKLIENMKKGAEAAHENVANFLDFYAKRYGSAFDVATNGLNANLGRLETSWTNFSRSIFVLSQEVLVGLVKFATTILETFTPVEHKIVEAKKAFEDLFKLLASPMPNYSGSYLETIVDKTAEIAGNLEKKTEKSLLIKTRPMDLLNDGSFSKMTMPGQLSYIEKEMEQHIQRIEAFKEKLASLPKTAISGMRLDAVNPEILKIQKALETAKNDMEMMISLKATIEDSLGKAKKENAAEGPNVGQLLLKEDKTAVKAAKEETALRKEILENRLSELAQAVNLEEQIYGDRNRELDKQYKAGLISLQDYSKQAQQLDAELTAKRVTNIKEQQALIQDEINKQQQVQIIVKSASKELHVLPEGYKDSLTKEMAKYAEDIKQASANSGVSEAIIWSIIGVESSGKADVINKAGARGLGQFFKAAWQDAMGKNNDYLKNSLDPQQSIIAVSRYFAILLEHYKGQTDQLRKAIAAYNRGMKNTDEDIVKGNSTGKDFLSFAPKENQDYVSTVSTLMDKAGVTPEVITSWETHSENIQKSTKVIEDLRGKQAKLNGEMKVAAANQADYATKVRETAMEEMNRLNKKYTTPDEVYTKEIALLDQLRQGIEGVRLSEEAYQKEKAAAKEKRDTANEKIFADATKPTNELKEYLTWVEKVDEGYKSLAVSSQDFFSGNSNWMDKLANSFGALQKALNKNTIEQQKNLEKATAAKVSMSKDMYPSTDPKVYAKKLDQIKEIDTNYTKTAEQLDAERYQVQVQGIASVSQALVDGLNTRSDSEQAAARKTVQAQLIVLGQAVALAVANQASGGDPYTVWARIAAVVATLASFGISRSGAGTGTPKIDTKTQGTVLGNREASSKSTEEIATIMKDVHASEYAALLNINDSIKDLSDSILTAITGIFQRGDLATPAMPADRKIGLASSITKNVSQNVLRGEGASIGAILDGYMLELEQFLEIKTTKGFLFGNLVKNRGSVKPVSEQTNKDVTAVFKNIGRVLMDAGEVFNMDVEKTIKALEIPDISIDIKDMTGEEAVKYFNAYISTLMDNLAAETYPMLLAYQQLGEGMAQTVVRVAADVGIVKSVFSDLGAYLPNTSEGLISVSEALVKAAGSTDKFRDSLSNFYTNFFTENEQLIDKLGFMTTNLKRFDVELPTSREGYKQVTVAKLGDAGKAQEELLAAKRVLEMQTKDAFAPFQKELDFLKHNAEIYGKEEKELYAIVAAERKKQVEAQVKDQQTLVTAAETNATKLTKAANLLLEQSGNADALYSALENSQEVLDEFGVTTKEKLLKSYSIFSTTIEGLGLSVPNTVQGFKELIKAQDLNTAKGKENAATLLLLAENALTLNETFKESQEELSSLQILGFSLQQADTIVSTLTRSFGDLGTGMEQLNNIAEGFLTDIQTKDLSKGFFVGKQQAIIDANPGWKEAGVQADMTPTQLMSLLKLTPEDLGRYAAREGLDQAKDPAFQFFNNASSLAKITERTAQDLASAQEKLSDTDANKVIENAKKFAEVQKTVKDAIDNFAGSDANKKVMAVNKEIQGLIDSVAGLSDTALEGIETLRALKLGLVNKELFDSMKPVLELTNKLGITNLDLATAIEKDATGLWSFSQAALDLIPSLSKVTDNIESFKVGLTALSEMTTTIEQSGMSDSAKKISDLITSSKKQTDDIISMLKLQYGEGSPQYVANLTKVTGTSKQAAGTKASEIFKPMIDEFANIGTTEAAKAIASLTIEMDGWRSALKLWSDSIGLSSEMFLFYSAQLDRIEATRRAAIVKQKNDTLAEIAMQYARLRSSDFEKQLFQISDGYIAAIKKAADEGATYEELLQVAATGVKEAGYTLREAQKELKKTFDEIYRTIKDKRDSISDKIMELQKDPNLEKIQYERYLADLQSTNFDTQMSAIEKIQSLRVAQFEKEIAFIESIKSITDALKVDDNLSPLTAKQRMDEAGKQFKETFDLAKAGDQTALGNLSTKTSEYLTEARSYFAGNADYAAIFKEVTDALDSMGVNTSKTPAERTAEATKNTVTELQKLQLQLEAIQSQQEAKQAEEAQKLRDSYSKVGAEFLAAIQALSDTLAPGSNKDVTFDLSELIISETAKQSLDDLVNSITKFIQSGTIQNPENATAIIDEEKKLIEHIADLIAKDRLTPEQTKSLLNAQTGLVGNLELLLKGKYISESDTLAVYTAQTELFKNLSLIIQQEQIPSELGVEIYTSQTGLVSGLSDLISKQLIGSTSAGAIYKAQFDLVNDFSLSVASNKLSSAEYESIYRESSKLLANLREGIEGGKFTLTQSNGLLTSVADLYSSIDTAVRNGTLDPTIVDDILFDSRNLQQKVIDILYNGQSGLTGENATAVITESNGLRTSILRALNSGTITEAQALDINAKAFGANGFFPNFITALKSGTIDDPAVQQIITDYGLFKGGFSWAFTEANKQLKEQTFAETPIGQVQQGINQLAINMSTGLSDITWLAEPGKTVLDGVDSLADNIKGGLEGIGISTGGISSAISSLMQDIANAINASSVSAPATTTTTTNTTSTGTGGYSAWVPTPVPINGRAAIGGIYDSPIIAAEAGMEAIIPLPGGRSVPVTVTQIHNNESSSKEVVSAIIASAKLNAQGQEELRRELAEAKSEIAVLNRKLTKLASE